MNGKSHQEGFSSTFITSLKTLFNVLDETGSGFVNIAEIENRWRDGEVDGLPTGVIDALRSVAAPNGLLSFDRFVSGLGNVMLRHKTGGELAYKSLSSQSTPNFHYRSTQKEQITEVQSAFHPVKKYDNVNREQLVQIKTSNKQSLSEQRTNSVPLLQHQPDQLPKTNELLNPHDGGRGFNMNEYHGDFNRPKERWDRKPGDGRSSVATSSALEFMNRNFIEQQGKTDGRSNSFTTKRRESRRHTLSSGLDNNMIKRLKLLEQEKDMLEQGLDAVNSARQWYEERLSLVREKQNNIGRTDIPSDQSFEANQERINLQMVRIQELNQQLKALMESPHKGFPLHMNLAVTQSPHRNEMSEKDNTIMMLKTQNRLLTKEVGERTNNIEQLEREKAQLIQKMFNSDSQHRATTPYKSHNDTTFI